MKEANADPWDGMLPLMTPREVAEKLGTNERTVNELFRDEPGVGWLGFSAWSSKMRIPRSVFERVAKRIRKRKMRFTVPPPRTEVFTAERVRLLTGPCVYQLVKDGEVVYIGSSINGLARILGNHHQSEARDTADKLCVTWMPTEWEARELEARLIKKKQPSLNRAGKGKLMAPLEAPRPVVAGRSEREGAEVRA